MVIEQHQFTGINIANLTNSFLRRDGDNTAIGAINIVVVTGSHNPPGRTVADN